MGMVPQEASESVQCPSPSLASPNAKDVLRRKHKRKSRQHQRFMARKALLQEQGLLSPLREPGPSPLPTLPGAPPGTEAASSARQRPRAEPGGAGCSRKPAPRDSAGPLPSKCVAIDCEMVGTGPRGRVSELARCSVVSYHGEVLYDKYIRPEMPIVDYRTRWSGITRQHMRKAIPFQVAQKEILKLLKGKVVVGHALHNDFQALKYIHPRGQTRDTTSVPSLLSQPGLHVRNRVSLKDLALQLLHKKIQVCGAGGERSGEPGAMGRQCGACRFPSLVLGLPGVHRTLGIFSPPSSSVGCDWKPPAPRLLSLDPSPTQFLLLSSRSRVEFHLLQPGVVRSTCQSWSSCVSHSLFHLLRKPLNWV
uniref:Apoptosis enhancing nuclease n=1 Tax=Bos mutus grunniens TaxID=30521 RepID=A0A8B9XFA5_BOSMU